MQIRTSIAAAGALLLLGCSGGAKAEKPAQSDAPLEAPAPDPSDATAELGLCLQDGAVPPGATHCLLDMNLVEANKGLDSFWRDTDGMDPGTAGCREEYTTDACTERKSAVTMGEFCIDEDRLIESTADAGVCEVHKGDVSTPQVISCAAWCATQGSAGGRCEPFVTAQGTSGTCESARCSCDSIPPA